MTRIKSLFCATVLTMVLAVASVGQAPPACIPGETLTPPCPSSALTFEEPAPSETLVTPPASESVEITSLAEFMLDLLLLF